VEFLHHHERDKALRKLHKPDFLDVPPDKQWRTTQWFGVPKSVLQTMLLLGEVEHTTARDGRDMWRKRR
jgi:hypothetical protein